MNNEIIIVSGLPRSGTSAMMQMLDQGGIEVVTDCIRADATWLPDTRGKAFKMVSQLLYDLPKTERYRIIFMERNVDEMLTSQEQMLQRLGKPAAPRAEIK